VPGEDYSSDIAHAAGAGEATVANGGPVLWPTADPVAVGHDAELYRLHAQSIHIVDGNAVCDLCVGAMA
jgi:hypothetical protein